MATEIPQLPHLQMVERGVLQDYKSRRGRGPKVNIPPRNRAPHGTALRALLESFVPISQQRHLLRAARALDQLTPDGITIEFQSRQGFDLIFKSLDLRSSGIELLNVRELEGVTYATCYVPEGRLDVLINKVRAYIEEDTPHGKPKNAPLIASIESIGLATIDALWTDEIAPPLDNVTRWWEVWLRRENLEAEACLQRFHQACQQLGIHVASRWIEFPERIVTNLEATRTQLALAVELLNLIAEIRRADLPPVLPQEPTLSQQDGFIDGMVQRLALGDDGVSIALLDTGINRNHPLLSPALDAADMHAVEPAWGTNDHHSHGTQMAGIALYGDLRPWADNAGAVPLSYRLESVKILAPAGAADAHQPFGSVLQQAVSRCEIQAPFRKRIICSAVSSPMHQDGVPSSYSAAVDQLAYGQGSARMIVLAAGNVPEHLWAQWPQASLSYGVEQPGQAWNALTVGAMTDMVSMPGSADFIGWNPVAQAGELGPFSASSTAWNKWPIKPEVVFEGGNVACDSAGNTELVPTMQLLTTHSNLNARPLAFTCMTSPAAAQAAGLVAKLQGEYPDAWPETLRALVVHHARWTAQQLARYVKGSAQIHKRLLLRACGWGVPKEDAVLFSARNRVSIVAQETIRPYRLEQSEAQKAGKGKNGSQGKGAMNAIKIFSLPWPKEMLFAMAQTNVRLRVTLSYFVEPSPSKRGWVNRYRYASHSLRFDLRRSNETVSDFNKRVNAAMLDEDEEIDAPADEGWFLGPKLRTSGSIHSDEWSGMAINLATRDLLAVYPVVGWWRECTERGHCENEARFSLILTLETDAIDANLYNAIHTELEIPISNELVMSLGEQ